MRAFLRNARIRTKLAVLLCLALLSTVLVVGIGLRHISVIGKELRAITNESLPLVKTLNAVAFHHVEQMRHVERAARFGTRMAGASAAQDDFETERERFAEHNRLLAQELEKACELLGRACQECKGPDRGRRLLEVDYQLRDLHTEHADHQFRVQRVFNLLAQGKLREAQAEIPGITTGHEDEECPVHAALERLMMAMEGFIGESVAAARRSKRTALVGMASVSGLVLLVAMGLAVLISRSITRPLRLAMDVAGRIAEGERKPNIQVRSRDEVGLLLTALQEMSEAVAKAEEALEKRSEELARSNRASDERVKELNALYELSRIAERPEMTPRQVLQEAVALLPPAWRYPDIACGRIRFNGEVFETHPGAESPWRQSAAIRVGGQERGCVEVCYLEEPPESDEGPFLKHERALIDALAGRLGLIIQRKEAEAALTRRTEQLARSNAELEQFAYVASHDLQEPLRMVSGYVKMLERRYKGQLDDDADDFIHFAVDGAERMAVLINDLLAYSRVTRRGKAFEPTDCETVMDEVLSNLEVAVTETGATVTHDPLPTVVADEVQLGRLLRNLIGNAIKYHGEAPPKVHVSAEQTGGGWQFAVRDNGIGIEPQYHQRIFAIFQRLHARDEYEGTGIGLAIAKKIVERHGGRIWMESEPGTGSTFYFTIPQREVRTDDESTDHAADEVYANAGQTGGGPPG